MLLKCKVIFAVFTLGAKENGEYLSIHRFKLLYYNNLFRNRKMVASLIMKLF